MPASCSLIIPIIWASLNRLFRIRLLLRKVKQTLHQREGNFGGQVRESSIQWHLDHHGISRQRLVETKDEQVKDLMVDIDLQVRELSERAWKHILETVIYHCDPDDSETISSEFDREVDNHYYSMKEKFETISELLGE